MSENPLAFPSHSAQGNGLIEPFANGMTLRDWLAGQAVAGVIRDFADEPIGGFEPDGAANIARIAFRIADAMLAEMSKA